MNNQIIKGSLGSVAKTNNQNLAAAFLNVKAIVMVDVSASMAAGDAGNGKTRYTAACEQLERLQNENAGEIAVACFSDSAIFCPAGVAAMLGSSTDMCAALRMLKMADGCGIRLILISDGEPNDRSATLNLAQNFTSKIDTIFVGGESSAGRAFLSELAAATGGISITQETEKLNLLSENITRLIAA